jgi:hypothetical protein
MTVPSDGWDIGGPGEGGGGDPSRWRNTAHLDHLVIFVNPQGEERSRPRGEGKAETYQVASTPYVICLTCQRCWSDADISGKALVPKLLTSTAQIVTGVLIEGERGQYDNAPILLADPMPAELEQARQVLDAHAVRLPSGRIVFDDETYNKKNAAHDEPF